MPLYSLNGETASIMTLAPVIPVLTVASVEDGVAQDPRVVGAERGDRGPDARYRPPRGR